MFAIADKRLGPVAIALVQYIKDDFLHLQDKHTYAIISETKVLQDDAALRLDM